MPELHSFVLHSTQHRSLNASAVEVQSHSSANDAGRPKARCSTAGDVPSVELCTSPLRCQQCTAASVASKGTPLWTPGWPPTPVETSAAGSCPLAVATAVCCCVILAHVLLAPARYAATVLAGGYPSTPHASLC